MTDVDRVLARHAQRRRQGLATLSVLTGPSAATTVAWSFHAGSSWAIDPAAATSQATLAVACVDAACRTRPLLAAAVAKLGRLLDRPANEVLGDRTAYDLDQMWRAADGAERDPLAILRIICTEPIERWSTAIATELPGWRGIVAIDGLLAEPPAVWVLAVDEPGWLATVAEPLAALATAVPQWTVGLGVPAEAFAAYRSIAGNGRAATLLCGGAVKVMTLGKGPTAELSGSVVHEDDDEEVDDDPARSAAERYLFERLNERWPGLFSLNVSLGFRFGSRPAEADLYAGALQLVIEIDGYHHFQDPACYRRDRRKDWAYQANGCHVVRVLAEDVVPRTGEILDRIAPAVEHCRRLMGVGPTGMP